MDSEGLAIDNSRPGPEIAGKRPQIQALVQFPRIGGNDPCAMGAYVFGKAFLRRMADVETAEINSYGKESALLPAASDCLHGYPTVFTQIELGVSEEGTTGTSYAFWRLEFAKIQPLANCLGHG